MSRKKVLSAQELEFVAENLSELSDYSYFDDSDVDPNYLESGDDESSESESRRKLDDQLGLLSTNDLEDNLAGPSGI